MHIVKNTYYYYYNGCRHDNIPQENVRVFLFVCIYVCESRECGGNSGGGDVREWHVSVIDDDIVPAFPRRPFRWRFI